jgi:hypothetical protein
MASEADSSILSPILSFVNTEKSTENKKKNINLWIHTRPPYEDELKRYRKNEIIYCKYCIEISHGSKSTSNFRQYLDSKHEIIIPAQLGAIRTITETQLRELYTKFRTTNQTIEVNSLAFRNALDKETITAVFISLITVRNLPFRIVKWPEFYVFCRVLNPEINGYIIIAYLEVGKMIQNL